MSYNLNNYIITNDKNKVAFYNGGGTDYYYQIYMVENQEYNGNNQFFTFKNNKNNSNKIDLYGIEPILLIKSSSAENYYDFRTGELRNKGTNNSIKIHVPYLLMAGQNIFSTSYNRCYSYSEYYNSNNGLYSSNKPHIADVQILISNGKLHIFSLCDIISTHSYLTSQSTTNKENMIGLHHRMVIYQQHALTNNGASINLTPTKISAFPIIRPISYDEGESGRNTIFLENLVNAYFPQKILIPSPIASVTDFHCGLIHSIDGSAPQLFCLIGRTDNKLELYTEADSFDEPYSWKFKSMLDSGTGSSSSDYAKQTEKFDTITTLGKPFNVYAEYINTSNFYLSYSYWNNGNIRFLRYKSDSFNWNTGWNRPSIIKDYDGKGNGFITYKGSTSNSTNITFIFDTSTHSYIRKRGTTILGEQYTDDQFSLTEEDLQWKYKLWNSVNGNTLKLYTSFSFTNNELSSSYPRGIGNERFMSSAINLYKIKNDKVNLQPLTISISKYINPDITGNYYHYYGNMESKKISSRILDVNSDIEETSFESSSLNYALPNSGNYFLSWRSK